jgi:hypothetical protein
MKLDRSFGRPEFSRNLLVQQAFDHQAQHLAFTWRPCANVSTRFGGGRDFNQEATFSAKTQRSKDARS